MDRRIIRNAARYLIAPVFIFSGFVKAIDPLGSTYKFTDYFEAFGIPWLSSWSFLFSVMLSSAELLIGLALLFRFRMKTSAWALLIFMIFFTLLTLYSVIKNPVTDCGCFGDAIKLSNWQTFFKNLIFLIPAGIIFWQRNEFNNSFSCWTEWIVISSLFLSGILLSVYCYRNLPLIDFRPYRIGTNITQSMDIPEGAPTDQYATTLIYEKNGRQEKFKMNDAPWNDSAWKWVETKNVLVKKGYEAPIHNFSISAVGGEDITQQVLEDEGYSILIVSYNLEKANKKGFVNVNRFAEQALENGFNVLALTASSSDIVEKFKQDNKPGYRFYSTDETTLKTMVRSNPGLMLIKEGTVLGIWSFRDIPDDRIFEKSGLSYSLSELNKSRNLGISFSLILIVGLMAALIYIISRRGTR